MWREVTEDDLVASISQVEVDTFRRSAANDPVEPQLRATVAFVRGIIRSAHGAKKMCPDERTLPEDLIMPAMDYLRFSIMLRMNQPANESRTKAYENAIALWRDIRTGQYLPEPYGEDTAGGEVAATPLAAPTCPPHLLD